MFTGIIQTVGMVRSRRRAAAGVSFVVSCPDLRDTISAGDSVAVNGVCQTVERVTPGEIVFTSVGETLERTTLKWIRSGARVNIEKAVTPGSPLGGHFVQGHVDGVGIVQSFVRGGQDWILKVRLPRGLVDLVVPKGSIAIDGASLTVIECGRGGLIRVAIVPYTLEHTVVVGYRSGTRVNIETDVLGKYVRRCVEGTRSVRTR